MFVYDATVSKYIFDKISINVVIIIITVLKILNCDDYTSKW